MDNSRISAEIISLKLVLVDLMSGVTTVLTKQSETSERIRRITVLNDHFADGFTVLLENQTETVECLRMVLERLNRIEASLVSLEKSKDAPAPRGEDTVTVETPDSPGTRTYIPDHVMTWYKLGPDEK